MKNIKWMLTALLAVAMAAPVFAQNQVQQNKVTKAIERAALQAAQQARQTDSGKCIWCGRAVTDENRYANCPADPDVRCNPADPNAEAAAKAHTCYRCGKSFRAGQHCSETGYTALCANSPEQEQALTRQQAEQEAACRARLEEEQTNYTTLYGTCSRCGRTITDRNIHRRCGADPDARCLVSSVPAPKTAAAENGRGDADVSEQSTENYGPCIWCGRMVNSENRYEKCPSDPDVRCNPADPNAEAAAKAHTCYRCGKSFRAGQHCSETGYTALCANSPEQERALQQAEEERIQKAAENSVCPKCGKAYTIDERYHHVTHICER